MGPSPYGCETSSEAKSDREAFRKILLTSEMGYSAHSSLYLGGVGRANGVS